MVVKPEVYGVARDGWADLWAGRPYRSPRPQGSGARTPVPDSTARDRGIWLFRQMPWLVCTAPVYIGCPLLASAAISRLATV